MLGMTTTADPTKTCILDFVDALQRRDPDAIRASFHADATWTYPGDLPVSGTWEGVDAILGDFLGTVGERVDATSRRFEVLSLTAEADRAALEWRLTARTTDGQDYDNTYLAIFELRDGRIAAVREYTDTAYVGRVLFGL
jgi:hypothetical protein